MTDPPPSSHQGERENQVARKSAKSSSYKKLDLDELGSLTLRFSDNGYQVWGEYQMPGRRYFTKGTAPRTHNIHCFQTGHTGLARHIAFRDYLVSNPEIAAEYGQLKRTLAAKCENDIESYCAGKDPFIKAHGKIALARNLP